MEVQTPHRKIIVIGGSAGSGAALRAILPAIPGDLRAAIFVMMHRTLIGGVDYVPIDLDRCGTFRAILPRDGEFLEDGRLYVAPVGWYLLIKRTVVRLERKLPGPSRNDIDRLFESAAISHGSDVIGVLLSGMLADGTAGLWDIRKHGGTTIVQDQTEAQCPSMPQSAMKDVPIDYCLRASEIGPLLRDLVRSSIPKPALKHGRIMIVEDDWLISADLEGQLNDLGYEVVANVVSGEEALSKAESMKPDVAIMDVRLVGTMKGTEVAIHLRERFRIPSIFLTAYCDMETLSAARSSMACAFLSKPHHASELNSAIQLALSGRESPLWQTGIAPKKVL
jgi:two-component system chemotaxis response regulator CheB